MKDEYPKKGRPIKGVIYKEHQWPGKDPNGKPRKKRISYVAEITYEGHRYRFRSTNRSNVKEWLNRKRAEINQILEELNKWQ